MGYDFEILYQPGLQKKAADALSKINHQAELTVMSTPGLVDVEKVLREVEHDEELTKIIDWLKNDLEGKVNFQWKANKLLYKGRLVLSRKSSLLPSLLHTYHDFMSGGIQDFSKPIKNWMKNFIG